MSKMIYAGIFLNEDDQFVGSLDKTIEHQHVTIAFKPDKRTQDIIMNHLGETVELMVEGYGCDDDNEGLKVMIFDWASMGLKPLFDNIDIPHITISVSETGKPKDTAKLEFENTPAFFIVGKIGYFDGREVIV